MVRFNNQGYDISKPYTEYKISGVNGETFVAPKKGNFNAETFDDIVNIQSKAQKIFKNTYNKVLDKVTGGIR